MQCTATSPPQSLLVSKPHQHKLLKSFSGLGLSDWMYHPYQVDPSLCLSSDEFREALRLRMGVPSFSTTCPCGHVTQRDPYHGFNCRGNQYLATHRHDKIRDSVFKFIRQCYPLAYLVKESPIQLRQPDGQTEQTIRPDIIFQGPDGNYFYLDITVVNSSASSYLNKDAFNDAYQRKLSKYGRLLGGAHNPAYNYEVIPLVFDVSGLPAPTTMEFIDRIANHDYRHDANVSLRRFRKTLLRHVATIAIKHSVAMIKRSRNINQIGALELTQDSRIYFDDHVDEVAQVGPVDANLQEFPINSIQNEEINDNRNNNRSHRSRSSISHSSNGSQHRIGSRFRTNSSHSNNSSYLHSNSYLQSSYSNFSM